MYVLKPSQMWTIANDILLVKVAHNQICTGVARNFLAPRCYQFRERRTQA